MIRQLQQLLISRLLSNGQCHRILHKMIICHHNHAFMVCTYHLVLKDAVQMLDLYKLYWIAVYQ